MGEIATWSAVKTKVGLGKDSNECPTKAELLALSPTGTGENYIGLEISNASSYGNNETVQLSDIHKVTYKYTFSQAISTLSFTALGGQSTNGSSIFNVISTKRKYLDGIATGSDIEVAYSSEDLPDWIIFQDNVFKALENTDLSSRNYTRLSTQSESGKTLSGSFTQAAATQSWEYTLSHGMWNETDDLYTAIAGEYRSYLIDERSYKQEKRNGKNYGPRIPVPVTVSSDSTWLTLNPTTFNDINTAGMGNPLIQTFQENKTLSRRYATITFIQAESGKKFTAKRYQAAGVKTYGNITITPTGNVPDIPASGGASHTFPYTWTQPWGWNGKTNDGGTLTTGGTETWNSSVSGSNLGTTPKARTKLGTRTVTVTCNGKSGTASKDVYQAANAVTKTTQGAWEVSIFANPSTFTEQGGTSQISASARAPRTNTWSSGATNAASDATGTPTLSIPTAVTGFSLSGTTLTVAENTTSNQRRVVVRATMGTVYKEVTVTQSAYLVEWRYYFTTSTPTLNFDALGTTIMPNLNSYREKYINGSLVEGSTEGVPAVKDSTTGPIQDVSSSGITMSENTTTQARTGTVVYRQTGSDKTVTITCNQAAGTVEYTYDIWYIRRVNTGTPTNPNIVVTNKVTEVELEGAAGSMNGGFATMELVIEKTPLINGVAQTPMRISSEFVKTSNSLVSVPSGQITANLASTISGDITNAIITIYNSVTNLAEYPRTHTVSFYRKNVIIDGKVVGQTPDITVKVNPLPYTRVFEFSWKEEGSTITNITLEGSLSGSYKDARVITSYASLRRNGVEFAKKPIKPTFIPPSEDWLQVVDKGQNEESYYYSFEALTDNDGESARNLSVSFEQPGNGNQSLYAYVSQNPKALAEFFRIDVGNFATLGDANNTYFGVSWGSKEGADSVTNLDTPGGYLGAWNSIPVNNVEDVITLGVVGRPVPDKPMKIRLSNLRRTKDTGTSMGEEVIARMTLGFNENSGKDYSIIRGVSWGEEIDPLNKFNISPVIGNSSLDILLRKIDNTSINDNYLIERLKLIPKDSSLPVIYLTIIYSTLR